MRIYIIVALLILASVSTVSAEPSNKQCVNFDQVALQLSLAQNGMQSPLTLEQIQLSLGANSSETVSNITAYSWIYKDRVLIVEASGSNISNAVLKGSDDGSKTSKQMEQIYATLKSATSVWSIKGIQNQLGSPGRASTSKLRSLTWNCGSGSITITISGNNDVLSADINYRANPISIETRIGPYHPAWDTQTDVLGQAHRAWKRVFTNQR